MAHLQHKDKKTMQEAGAVIREVEGLPSECEVLSSNSSTTKK
jgi:hypothetical protein